MTKKLNQNLSFSHLFEKPTANNKGICVKHGLTSRNCAAVILIIFCLSRPNAIEHL
jgi:hypothetical protein